jgi:hypothetical protein
VHSRTGEHTSPGACGGGWKAVAAGWMGMNGTQPEGPVDCPGKSELNIPLSGSRASLPLLSSVGA